MNKIVFIVILAILTVSCQNNSRNTDLKALVQKEELFVAIETDTIIAAHENIDTLDIMVVQCANGYEYAQRGYNFNPVIESELDKFGNLNIKPFPLKDLMGVTYQGVFDSKYCPPIIEKVKADFLLLTRFDKKSNPFDSEETWGYELRIVNTKSLAQINSISAHNLSEYEQIAEHIKENIKTLKIDIEKLK